MTTETRMYSLKDITNGCVKIEIPDSARCNQIISTREIPVVKVEISESSCSTVHHQTISLPQESICEGPSLEEVNSQEDVLKIQISNVQGALSDQTADSEAMPVYKIENHVDEPNSGAELHDPAVDVGNQEKLLPAEIVRNGQPSKQVTTQENMSPKMSPMESEEQSPGRESPVYNGEALAETGHQEKQIPFQLSSLERTQSYRLSHHPDTSLVNSQYPVYQISSNGTKSAYLFDTLGKLSPYQNGATESAPSHQMDTDMVPSSSPLSSHATVPLYHMEETPTSQSGEKNKSYQINYYNGMPTYYGDYSFHDFQQGIPFWPPESRDLVPSNQKKAHNCNCCCHAQNDYSRYPDVKNQRPSVIMVPVSWSSSDSGISHLPLKVKSFYIIRIVEDSCQCLEE